MVWPAIASCWLSSSVFAQHDALDLCPAGTVQLALSGVLSSPHLVQCANSIGMSPEAVVRNDRLTSAQVVAFRDASSCASYHHDMMDKLLRIYPVCVDPVSRMSTATLGSMTFAQRVKSLTS
ncbi:hypothetical protein H310_04694 [Aphanomyces invadans]|uniref:Secreted protein n=1 Tax=Aphanomyces invadans TaxID=157072 RepID=A0A024UFN6_9STRA|nr:hypothetical protein H310_04694 [Aphanomyces invadans]ETW04413.1 hypothetical protein H310_04694 [Aphanomyces invadans]|eukprot:XP_008867369.1 hypothetical protein H310_04694 [Aphanomyces invadans]